MDAPNADLMLNDGSLVDCIWLTPENKEPLLDLSRQLKPDMVGRHRQDLTNPKAVEQWLGALGKGGLSVLVAQDPGKGNRAAGYVYLQKGMLWSSHMGTVEAYVHPDYRNLGLGSALLREIVRHAEGLGLMFAKAELPAERRDLVTAYKRLGFHLKAILEDYRVDRTGKPYDVLIMTKRVMVDSTQEFLYSY